MPHTSASWLDTDEEAIFALANQTEGITLVKLGSMKGIVTVHTLKASSYLGRLWDNIGGKLWILRNFVIEGVACQRLQATPPLQVVDFSFVCLKSNDLI